MTPITLVLHRDYGGFHVNTEMALWLMENRRWVVTKTRGVDTDLVDEGISEWYTPAKYAIDSVEFRSNPDLVDCVRDLQKRHENDEFPDSRYGYIHNLRIVTLRLNVEIEHYNDGHERINAEAIVEDEDGMTL